MEQVGSRVGWRNSQPLFHEAPNTPEFMGSSLIPAPQGLSHHRDEGNTDFYLERGLEKNLEKEQKLGNRSVCKTSFQLMIDGPEKRTETRQK